MKLSGHYDQMIAVPVLKRRVQAPEVIGEDDIDWEKQPASHLRKNIVTNAHDLTGKSPKRVISQGRPIRADEIANPPVVNKGSQVTLYFKSRNLEIKTFGEALEPGAVGDVIRVRNITSKTIVQGTVMSGDRVRVASPDTDSAEAM
jgi:flagella basal body P-ring formation protein FlgA